MNKKVITKIATMVLVMGLIALVIAKLYDIGTHRPSLAYRQLSPQTIQWINAFSHGDPESIIKAASVGPFEWDNKEDIGQKHTAGKWAKEEDANTVIYYRRDREAQGQMRARRVADCVENIILELPAYLGTYHYPADLNGRKIAIYLPATDDEYNTLLNKLSGNGTTGTSKYGCSIIAIGPLGCQNKGIILHPDGFMNMNADGDPEYIRVVRRELAYYTYMAGLDYNRDTRRYAWFVQGVVENFALDGRRLPDLKPELVSMLDKDCQLNAEFPTKSKMHQWGGTSFIQFYEMNYGSAALSDLITATYQMPVDSALMLVNPDLSLIKQQWIASLGGANEQLPDTPDEQ